VLACGIGLRWQAAIDSEVDAELDEFEPGEQQVKFS
jgi:hypothetical protein